MELFLYVLVGVGIAAPFLYLNIFFSPRMGWIDWPKFRGVNEDQIPIIGHSLVAFTLLLLLGLSAYSVVSPWFVLTAAAIAVMGFMDDKRPIEPVDKLLCQLGCAFLVVYLDPLLGEAIQDKYGNWGAIWAVFFIMGLVNSVNFIDGIDGLAGVVIGLGAMGFIGLAQAGQFSTPYGIVAALIAGMVVPFLYLNVIKRFGFLGNIGSYFFSYVLAVMHLSLPFDSPGPFSRLALSGLCFLIPIADSVTVIYTRLVSVRSPFQPDKGHLHHQLLQTSIQLRYILLNFSFIEITSVLTAVVFARNAALYTSSLPFYLGAALVSIAAVLIFLIERSSRRRVQTYLERLNSGEPIFFMRFRVRKNATTPLSSLQLKRLESRISSEIRVTDFCYSEPPDTLFVTLKSAREPILGISSRMDRVFQLEGIESVEVVDRGEIQKHSDRSLFKKTA